MLLRNIEPGSSAALRPEDVPAVVDDATLAAVLRAGRPDELVSGAQRGLLTVRGLACPTIAAGSGRPVLCVHGLGHDAWDFGPLFVRCTKAASLLAFDLPGFGLADKVPPASAPAQTFDMELYVEALLAAAALAPEPPVVVASSLGGHIALIAAMRAPRAFARLVLAAPGGLVGAPGPLQALLRAYYAVDSICARSEQELTSNSHKIFARRGLAAADALAARKLAVHRSARKREFAVPFAGIVDDVFRHVIMDRVADVRVPTLILSGERDVVVPPDACATAARRMGARFVSFPGVGHCPHLEIPDVFADAVVTFIHGEA